MVRKEFVRRITKNWKTNYSVLLTRLVNAGDAIRVLWEWLLNVLYDISNYFDWHTLYEWWLLNLVRNYVKNTI